MAEIAGFKGLLFDPARVDMDKVLAPPYDVIDDAGRAELAALDDKNCVRIILPESEGDADARYTHARELLESWTEEGTLVHDEEPALYRYHQVYTRRELGDEPVTRRGFIAAVRLHNFEERVLLRHERTLKGPKVDRLKLWHEHFPPERLLVLRSEDLYEDPPAVLDQVIDFLGLPSWKLTEFKAYNQKPYQPIRPETRRGLAEYFAPHNQRLYEYLGRDFGWS